MNPNSPIYRIKTQDFYTSDIKSLVKVGDPKIHPLSEFTDKINDRDTGTRSTNLRDPKSGNTRFKPYYFRLEFRPST